MNKENVEVVDSDDEAVLKEVVDETPNERFKRIAGYRVNKVLNDLRILSTVGTATGYEYSKEEVDKMFASVDAAVAKAKMKFEKNFNEEFKF